MQHQSISQPAQDIRPVTSLVRPQPSEHEKLVQQSQKWVAQSFYGTLLKQARESPFHSDKFEGGRGGQAFGPLLDQHIAEHMARGAGRRLPEAIARKIEAKRAYGKSAGGKKNGSNQDKASLLRSIHATPTLRA
jgi:Rod binding domain-containing protein